MPSPTLQRLVSVALATAALLMPGIAAAYFSPEEVLLNKEFFLPPTARESQGRVENRQVASDERRSAEQEDIFTHAAAPEDEEEGDTIEVDNIDDEWIDEEDADNDSRNNDDDLSGVDTELLRTLRLLNRIEETQRVLKYGKTVDGEDQLHGGAPPLAPTGAPAWIAAGTMIGAVVWTMRRAKRSERDIL